MSFRGAGEYIAREIHIASIKESHEFFRAAGDLYLRVCGERAPDTILYSKDQFAIDFARRLAAVEMPADIEAAYIKLLVGTYKATFSQLATQFDEAFAQYQAAVVPHQNPGKVKKPVAIAKDWHKQSYLQQKKNDAYSCFRAFDGYVASVGPNETFENKCKQIEATCATELNNFLALRSYMYVKGEELDKILREQDRLRTAKRSFWTAVGSGVIAIAALIVGLAR